MKTLIINDFFEMNCYIVEKEGKGFVVDPGGDINSIKEAILGIEVEFVLLTHGHFDHIDGLSIFKCPVYIHKDDFLLISDIDKSSYKEFGIKPRFDYHTIDFRLIDEGEISFLDEKIKVIHTPGHTKGSVCYLYKDKLFSGDTIFKGSVGRTDLYSGSSVSMKKSVIKILDMLDGDIKIYPGHDEKTTVREEKKHNEYYVYYKKNA